MRFRSPSLPELHAFLSVCRLGSFRKAAEHLCVTQAAVSRAILRLEERVGCVLIDRSRTPAMPTARGLALQSLTAAHVDGLESGMERFCQSPTASRLRVSVAPTLGTRWLVPRLPQFQALHPAVAIELRQFRYDENFSRDDVDVWIEIKRPHRAWPRGIQARYLLGEEIVPACTPALAAGLRSAHDLLTATLLQHTNYPDNWRLWLSQAAGIDQPPAVGPGFDLGNHLIVAACGGMGVTVIQPALIEPELQARQLVLPFRKTATTGRGYYLCTRRAPRGSQAVDAFATWLLDQARASAARYAFG